MSAIFDNFVDRVRKILNLRLFDDETGKAWDKNVMDKQYEVLCVSQVGEVFFCIRYQYLKKLAD